MHSGSFSCALCDIAHGQSILTFGPGTLTYSGLDASGALLRVVYDCVDGRSGVFAPANGSFGFFRTETYHAGSGGDGAVTGTLFDIGNGSSTTSWVGSGASGVYRVGAVTDGYDGGGAVERVVLDDVNETSTTFAPIAGDPGHEDETETSPPISVRRRGRSWRACRPGRPDRPGRRPPISPPRSAPSGPARRT